MSERPLWSAPEGNFYSGFANAATYMKNRPIHGVSDGFCRLKRLFPRRGFRILPELHIPQRPFSLQDLCKRRCSLRFRLSVRFPMFFQSLSSETAKDLRGSRRFDSSKNTARLLSSTSRQRKSGPEDFPRSANRAIRRRRRRILRYSDDVCLIRFEYS